MTKPRKADLEGNSSTDTRKSSSSSKPSKTPKMVGLSQNESASQKRNSKVSVSPGSIPGTKVIHVSISEASLSKQDTKLAKMSTDKSAKAAQGSFASGLTSLVPQPTGFIGGVGDVSSSSTLHGTGTNIPLDSGFYTQNMEYGIIPGHSYADSVRNTVGWDSHGCQFVPANDYSAEPIFTESDFPALNYEQPRQHSRFPGTASGSGKSKSTVKSMNVKAALNIKPGISSGTNGKPKGLGYHKHTPKPNETVGSGMLNSEVDTVTSDACPGTEPTHTGNTRLFTSIDSGTGYSHSAGDSSDENHATGTDGTVFLPQVFSIPESSTVHVTVPSAPIVSSVRVSIPLEYLTSSVNFQSTNPAYYSNAPSYQQVSIPQRNYGYHGYGNFHHGMGYGGPSWSQGPRFPAPNCSQQDFNNVLRTLHELSSSLSELKNQTQTRLDQSSNHTSVSANQQNISSQDSLADEVDNNESSYEGEDQYSDVSPYSPNSNIDPADQEVEPLGYGDAIVDVFQLLGDKCPRQEDSGTKKILSTLERSKGHGNDKSFERLPHSEVVNDIVTEFSRDSKDSRRKVEWSLNAKVLKSNTAPRSYKVHKQYWPTSLPTLDEAANRVGMTSGKDIRVPVSYLESTEKLARQAVTVASHCDLFLAAADSALEQENFNVASLKNLLLAASRTARHSCGLGVAISANTLHWRRNAALSTSRILLQSSKDSLRAAPLNSDTLFGNLVSEISERDLSDQHHHVLAKVSQTPQNKQGQKRPQSSDRNKGENKKGKFEQKSPLLNSAPQNRNYQPRGGKRGGRGRFSNSRPKYSNK